MLLFCQCFDVWRLLGAAERPQEAVTPRKPEAEDTERDARAVEKAA